MANDATDPERFLDEAVDRGLLSPADAVACRRVLAALADVQVDLGVAEVVVRKGLLTREQVTEIQRALARRRIGRYEVLEQLGSGGNGVVWRARDTRLGRTVALKVLARPRDATDVLSAYVARFEREARTAVTLNHVNIVRGLDFGESDGYVFFAMEFVAGETAAERVRRLGRLSEQETLRVALQVVEALRHVQRYGLVHRDLKPDNLLLTPTGEVKVCDLGLAKPTLEESSRLASRGVIAGTPLYMAPEQIRDPDAIDWRTDVYGLGATLYHLLTGRPPFVPRPGTSVIQRHLEEPPVDPREHVLELSSGVASVVMKMLAKRPEQRYESLDALSSDLSAVLDGRPPTHALELVSGQERVVSTVLAASHAAHRRRRSPRRRLTVALGAAAAVAALVVASVSLWPGDAGNTGAPRGGGTSHDAATAVTGGTGSTAGNAGTAGAPELGDGERLPGRGVPGGGAAAGAESPAGGSQSRPPFDPGTAALRLARELDAAAAPLRDRIQQYKHTAERFTEHASGRAAAERVVALRDELETLAEAELARRRQDVGRLVAADEFARAADVLSRFPPDYQGTRAHDAALADAQRISRDGRSFVDRAFDAAQVATAEWRFDTAREWIARMSAAGMPGSDVRRSQALLGLELAQLSHDTEREEQAVAFHLMAGRALLMSRTDHEIALRDVMAATRDPAFRTYRAELEALAAWVPRAERAADAVRRAWERWTTSGRQVAIRTVGAATRDVVGRAAGTDGALLLVGSAGEAPSGVRVGELRVEFLREALETGDPESGAEAIGQLGAALLLSARRPADAATLGAPSIWVDAVRAVAVADADARISSAARPGRSPVEARDLLDAVIADVPWYGAVYQARALLLEKLGDLDGAVRDLESALEKADRHGDERIDLARILERRGRLADAEGHLRLFLDSRAAGESPRTDEAEAALARVEAARVDSAVSALRRDAQNALRRRRGDEAMPLLDRILQLRPDDAWALFESGRLHAQRGAVFAAYRTLRRLVDSQPDDRHAIAAQRELAALERYRAGVPAGREAQAAGRAALDAGDVDLAVSHQRTALRRSPFLVDAHLGLAEALLARGVAERSREDLEAARDGASDALLLAPEFTAARAVRARALLALGDAADALRDAETAAASLPDPTDVLIVAGRALLDLGRLDDAYERMQEAFERRRHADPVFWQALILERRGERRAALLRLDFLYEDLGGAPAQLREECEELYLRLRE